MKINFIETTKQKEIESKYGLSPFISKILASMKLSETDLDSILNVNKSIFDYDVTFVRSILDRLYLAKMNNQKILIAGDYDCDGICATTILYDALSTYGIDCGYYIPNRFTEGYGINTSTVELAHDKGYQVIVTVDNGVTAKEALMLAKQYGIDVILTDHHNYEESELVYDLFLHPSILGDEFKYLCGAGLAFLIAKELIGTKQEHVILAGIATIADIVPVLGFNRAIVKECINLLNQNMYPQIQLLQNDYTKWDEIKIAFQIAPKINSVGRLADIANANNVVRFFLMKDIVQIQTFVKQLNDLNKQRKQISDDMFSIAYKEIKKEDPFVVLHNDKFHEGINGIVASKISKEILKPVMCLSEKENKYVGSIRSDSVDLRTFFDDLDILLSFGGHKQAAGISLYQKDIDILKNYIILKMKDMDNDICLDCLYLDNSELTLENFLSLDCLKPFGQGFKLPVIITEDKIINSSTLSGGKHLKLQGKNIEYLYFNHGMDKFLIDDFSKYYFIGKVEINTFRNVKSLKMIIDKMVLNEDFF